MTKFKTNIKIAINMLWLMLCSLMVPLNNGQTISISWRQLTSPTNIPYLPHFWTSTGFSPINTHGSTEGLLSKDMLTNIALIGSLPHGSITHVRIHWLLDLVTARRNETEVEFDFSHLDLLISWLRRYKLYPGFELMGNPSTLFYDLENETQQRWWNKLVTSLTSRYIAQYGLNEIKNWRVETWNEPDLKMYNTLNFTTKGFKAYVLASMNGLREASGGEINLGGPAGLFRTPRSKHPLCWAFLDLVSKQPSIQRPSFISYHRKGNTSSHLIVEETLQLVRIIKKRYPTLLNLPFANDEADPLTGWWRAEDWRADVRYAAMMARVAIEHLNILVRRQEFAVKFISNDNAFLSMSPNYFTQRTLLARFQMNDTEPGYSQFFLKPVYFTLALMSLLGDRELLTTITPSDPRVAVLAAGTWHKDTTFSAAVLLVFNNQTEEDPSCRLHLNLTLPLSDWVVEVREARYTVFLLDNNHTNPAAVWKVAGSPDFPDDNLRRAMRQVQEYRAIISEAFPESGIITVNLQLPSVAIIQLCTRPETTPGQVSDVHLLHVSRGEVLLLWRDTNVNSKCLLRYDVEFRPIGHQHFHRINLNLNSILPHFHFQNIQSTEESIRGEYRIRAVDLWNRPGLYSKTLHF